MRCQLNSVVVLSTSSKLDSLYLIIWFLIHCIYIHLAWVTMCLLYSDVHMHEVSANAMWKCQRRLLLTSNYSIIKKTSRRETGEPGFQINQISLKVVLSVSPSRFCRFMSKCLARQHLEMHSTYFCRVKKHGLALERNSVGSVKRYKISIITIAKQ